jgi:hypothetical protein
MRKVALLVGGTAVLALAVIAATTGGGRAQPAQPALPDSAAAPTLAAGDTSGLAGPRQPIFFRHDIHAGQFKIACQYCHYSVAASSEPGIPSLGTCMNCHLVISGTDSAAKVEIRKLREANTAKQPVEWLRIHTLARHVRFPHSRHIKAMGETACVTCHGDIARMPQVFKVNNVNNMGWCVTCHLERNVTRDCSACHY